MRSTVFSPVRDCSDYFTCLNSTHCMCPVTIEDVCVLRPCVLSRYILVWERELRFDVRVRERARVCVGVKGDRV